MLLEQVYELLKEQIIDRVYGPGDKLNIDAIAREMKVSSTPVREALARLVAEGLVAAVPYRLCRFTDADTQVLRRSVHVPKSAGAVGSGRGCKVAPQRCY